MTYDYNTQRKRMALPEYGRNVQKMVDHIKTIEDRDERNRAAKTIIQIMGNLNPHIRDVGDSIHLIRFRSLQNLLKNLNLLNTSWEESGFCITGE
jgi:CRISPR/Cas system-associated endonuclease Cas1